MTSISFLHIQRYLRGEGTIEALALDYAVRTNRHPGFPNLVLFKYDQINSPMDHPLVQECRGIILDEADGGRVVARPFDKFFNYGEPNAVEIDWGSARVQEKLDGSLCVFYHYAGEWHVATSGSPDAGGNVHNGTLRFRDLIWETARQYGLQLLSPAHTYLCELTSPHNRIVVQHREASLTLLGIRHTETGAWEDIEASGDYLKGNLPRVRMFPLGSYEEMLTSFEEIDPLQQEGYVVVDGRGQRVKVKHPRYVALHLLKERFNAAAFVEVLQSGEVPELLTYFPEMEADFIPLRTAYEALIAEIDRDFERLKGIETQKEFAAMALPTRCSHALFALRAGRYENARCYLSKITTPACMRLLGLKSDDTAGTNNLPRTNLP